MLKGAGNPVKAAQLEKECQVPRKDINRALYRMKDKLQVDRDDSAKWSLREGGPGEMVPTEPARPSHGNLPTLGGGGVPSTSSPGNGQAWVWAWVWAWV